MMIEPTETETKATLDAFCDAMLRIAEEAERDPQLVKDAPHTLSVGRLDEANAARCLNLCWMAPEPQDICESDGPALRDIADDMGAPQVIFTDPQVCSVGRTEAQARADGFPVRAVEYDMGQVTGAYLQADGYTGRAKAVVDEDRRVLLGVTFVGPAVADLLHSATIAVTAEVPLDRLWHAVPSFPTVSEIWLRLMQEYGL